MADLRIPYVMADNYLGQKIAEMVADFNASYNSLQQVMRMIGAAGDDTELETALGMPHTIGEEIPSDYGYHLRGLLTTQKAAFDSLATDIGKIDKGV